MRTTLELFVRSSVCLRGCFSVLLRGGGWCFPLTKRRSAKVVQSLSVHFWSLYLEREKKPTNVKKFGGTPPLLSEEF